MTRRSISSRGRSVLAAAGIVAAMMLGAIAVPGIASGFWTPTSSSGSAAATAATLGTGAKPTVSASAQSVTVSWTGSTPADGYVVTRYGSGGTLQTILAGCAGTITATTCTESGVPAGSWQYTVTPRYKNWVGVEGAKSSIVTTAAADTTPPVHSFSLGSVTGAALGSGTTANTIYYRGVVAGSFTLVDALSDTGSGPASISTGQIMGTGFTHSQSNVTSGPPYTSAPVSWTAGTTASPTWGVDGFDKAGNRAPATLTFVNDSAAPTGGAISYANGVTRASTVAVQITAVTDGSGSGLATRTLQQNIGTLTGTTCSAWGGWDTALSYTGDNAFSYDMSVTTGRCYQFRFVGVDRVGNTLTTTSTAVVKATGAYAATVLSTSGLLSLWRLDDSGSTSFADSAGSNTGTYTGTTATTPGATADGDAGRSFAGGGTGTVARTIADDFTIEFWMRFSGGVAGSGSQWFNGIGLVDAETPGIANDFGVAILPGGRIGAGIGGGSVSTGGTGVDVTVPSAFAVNDGAWHHVVMTRIKSTGAIALYIDGALSGSATGSTSSLTASNVLSIAQLQTKVNGTFTGSLDDIAIYSRALTATEVSSHYSAR
ncbi:hypothetical protein GCM10027515_12720 [Schumannella luteola]|uniref:Laminin G domain-containing protein n=1 Tax=Schumannella luteola TaxID=472059 RepID=A0A852Y8L3_9MICO|nr:LamG-like jellyroll fold domain-containing protein [Schumannella luteola]NYG97720.1 hypothetical protein [Schumannella luteola]TPX01413.1 LamG domain-containing protein [Schumannella luteola]